MNETEDVRLRRDCTAAADFWRLVFGGLSCVAYRRHGAEAFHQVRVGLLGHHQTGHYREGLRKLGIRDDEPPAVAAAKYHFLSNSLGGLSLQYIEESPRKVWLRYLGPMWTFQGLALLALPASMRRSDFTAWHPNNGLYMGCPRLAWVLTKSISEGDPYDEGYFIETDHDLKSDAQCMRYETVSSTPEWDPARQPVLDPQLWPMARRLKVLRRFSGGYVQSSVAVLCKLFGEREAASIVAETMSLLAAQFTAELAAQAGVVGHGAQSVGRFFLERLLACEQSVEVLEDRPKEVRLRLDGLMPFDPDIGEPIRAACFEFQRTATRILDGRVSAARTPIGSGTETWVFRDEGRWLW